MPQPAIPFIHGNRGAGRRRAARVRLALPGRIVLVTGPAPCLLDDLSTTGASVTIGSIAPPIGESAMLIVDGIEAFGTVVWHKAGHFGVLFEDPLTQDDIVRLRTIHDRHTTVETERLRRSARDFVHGRRV